MSEYLWLAAGLVLCTLEMVIPGIYLIWLGASALVIGGILFAAPDLSLFVQLGLFAVLSMFFVGCWSKFFQKDPSPDHESYKINRAGLSHVGKNLTLDSPIADGRGAIFIGDTRWHLSGPDMQAGTKVRVVGVDRMALKVESPSE